MNKMTNECLGVVLAGGLSSRMGEDKAQLMRNNTNMLNFSQQLLTDADIANVVVSMSHQQRNSHEQVKSSEQEQISDIVAQAGPVGGIYSVIKQYQPKALLVLPVDLPLMTSQALAKLKQVGELTNQACFYHNHSIPLYLPINAFVEMFLQQAFQHQNFKSSGRGPSIRTLLQQVPHQEITIDNTQWLFNTNTPEQWQQAKTMFNRQLNSKSTTKQSLGSL